MYQFQFRKIWSRKKVSVSVSKNLVSEKSLGFGFGKFAMGKKVSVMVSVKILVLSFSASNTTPKPNDSWSTCFNPFQTVLSPVFQPCLGFHQVPTTAKVTKEERLSGFFILLALSRKLKSTSGKPVTQNIIQKKRNSKESGLLISIPRNIIWKYQVASLKTDLVVCLNRRCHCWKLNPLLKISFEEEKKRCCITEERH